MGRGEGEQLEAPVAALRSRGAAAPAPAKAAAVRSLREGLTEADAQHIFGNRERKKEFLALLDQAQGLEPAKRAKSLSAADINKELLERFDYDEALPIIREMFRSSEKYAQMAGAEARYEEELAAWNEVYPGEKPDWAFTPSKFDEFRAKVARDDSLTRREQLRKIGDAAQRNFLLGELNTARNDMIEHLIFEQSKKILPTFSHSKGIDFYVDGEPYDQKISRSPTGEWIRDKGEGWQQAAAQNPAEVAEYLYRHQDRDRFSAEPRLLIVNIDEGIGAKEIKRRVSNELRLDDPHQIEFEFDHGRGETETYQARAHVLILS